MTPKMEELGRHVDEWECVPLGKGLKVNGAESNAMVANIGGNISFCCCNA